MKRMLLTLMIALAAVLTMSASEPTVIFTQDFNAFTEGTEQEPSTTDISTSKLGQTLKGWSGKNVYEAGGKLLIGDYGYLQSSRYDMSANSGIVRITLRVKALSETGGVVRVKLGYTTTKDIYVYDSEWYTLSIITTGGTSSTYVRVEPYITFNGIMVDELKVETSPDFFPVPEALQPTKADGTSFTARWARVTGAKAYILDVYTKAATGRDYVLHNDTVTTTTRKVTDLDASKKYYYVVRATNGTAVSDYSNEIEVIKVVSSIEAPVATAATGVTETGFTANWKSVPEAELYKLNVYKNTRIKEAGLTTLLSEDFSGVTQGTFTSVEFGKLQEYLDDYTHQSGWYGVNHVFAAGTIGLAPYGDAASLTTPYLDLSNDEGKVQATINMDAQLFGESLADTVQVQLVDAQDQVLETVTQPLAGGFKPYVINFTKGAANAAVRVYYTGKNKVFIDQMSLAQVLPAGYEIIAPMLSTETEGTSLDVTGLDPMGDGVSYSYTVQSACRSVDYKGEIIYVYSAASNLVKVENENTGIDETVTAKGVKRVTYYDLAGRSSATPHQGVNVVVTIYTDGTKRVTKVVK